jgi:predicted acyl esterase
MNLQARPRRHVVEIENDFIELSDGCRLAARIWMPADAEEHPVPAILEYIPYRKRDGTAPRDQTMHPAVAPPGVCRGRRAKSGECGYRRRVPGELICQGFVDCC